MAETRRAYYLLGAALMVVAMILAISVVAGRTAHAASTFTVNSTGDANDLDFPSGTFDGFSDGVCDVNSSATGNQCTLRAAIEEANVSAGTDAINFHIGGTGVHTISPTSPLPDITEAVIINGYSQPGSSVNKLAKGTNAKLLIEINGTNSGGSIAELTVAASNSVVKGLVINRFPIGGAIQISPNSISPADVVTNVRIEGNFIGTDPSGTLDRGNEAFGVFIFHGSYNTIGGTSPAARNLISANGADGVAIDGASGAISVGNKVQGNLIGTQKDGIHALGNDDEGVDVFGDRAFGNRILSNAIFSNGLLGIELGANGPTANDSGDTDTGANGLQNFPVISSARTISGKTTIKGTLKSGPLSTYTIQFFSNPPNTDEGRTFIGQKSVSTNINGNVSFSFSPKKAVAVGQAITATATMNTTGDTSEFSAPKAVQQG